MRSAHFSRQLILASVQPVDRLAHVGTVRAHEAACVAANAAEVIEEDPVPPQGGAALPDPDGQEEEQRRSTPFEEEKLAA